MAEKPPEVGIETEEDVKKLGDKTTKDIEQRAEDFTTSGKERFEGVNENIGLESEAVEEIKETTGVESELQTIQKEVQELTSETQEEIKEVTGEKPVEIEKRSEIEERIENAEEDLNTLTSTRNEIAKTEIKEPISDEEKAKQKEALRKKYKEELEKIPKLGKKLERDENDQLDLDQDISWENLALVRATDYIPKIENHELKVLTPWEATKGTEKEIPRITTHWCMNHKVESHIEGNWDDKPYLIISPGEGTIEKNGKPENLYAVDTF